MKFLCIVVAALALGACNDYRQVPCDLGTDMAVVVPPDDMAQPPVVDLATPPDLSQPPCDLAQPPKDMASPPDMACQPVPPCYHNPCGHHHCDGHDCTWHHCHDRI